MLDHADDDLSLSTMQTLLLESNDIQGFLQDFTDLLARRSRWAVPSAGAR
ncbi:hypothetical protein [Brachybacterium sp. GPGPB12]